MSDIDLDAIAERWNSADQNLDSLVCQRDSAQDVPALLARLAEVEAERDAAREQWREAYNDSSVRHDAALKREWRKAQDLATEVGLMRKERDNLAAENARLREVVEAAEELPTDVFLGLVADAIAVAKLDRKREFYQAVFDQLQDFDTLADAYRASQNTPARPPESTESQDQAEPAVASTNTAQAQRGAQGDWETLCPVREDRAHCDHWYDDDGPCCDCGEGSAKPKDLPADPPGLDAAIEAARAYLADNVDDGDQLVWEDIDLGAIKAAVRAAAPALRAGALRDAAEDWEAFNPHEPGMASMAARWLRERADRIGGAT